MNLVVDFGNTRIKAALFHELGLVQSLVFSTETQLIEHFKNNNSIQHALMASVTKAHEKAFALFSEKFFCRLFTSETAVPISNRYQSVSSLGSDRLAASIGAFSLYPNQNVLTIDAGTCVKYNFVNSANEFIGGAISPGIRMRLKALHEHTSALPLVPFDITYSELTGTNTQESILSGALTGTVCEVDGMIERYKEKYQDLIVVLTGGDSDYLSKQLKNRFFAHQNILLQGLHTILQFNLNLET